MHLTTLIRRRLAAGVLALTGLTGATAQAQPVVPPPGPRPTAADRNLPPSDVKVDPKTGTLDVPLGGTARYTPPDNKPITDIVNRSEDVLEVRVDPKSPTTLLFVGRRPGFTRLTVTYTDGTEQVFDVVVRPDLDLLRNVIKLAVPTANVEVIPGVGTAVILTGYVTKPEDADTILRIASDATQGDATSLVNAIQVGGVQHVLIDVTIASVEPDQAPGPRVLVRRSTGRGPGSAASSRAGRRERALAGSGPSTSRPPRRPGQHRGRDQPRVHGRPSGPPVGQPGQVPVRAEARHPDRPAGLLPQRRPAGRPRPGVRDQRPGGRPPAGRDRTRSPPDRVRER